jgi:hypothetical protein
MKTKQYLYEKVMHYAHLLEEKLSYDESQEGKRWGELVNELQNFEFDGKEQQYIITECNSTYYINEIPIENDVFSNELVDYRIENREELINSLIDWIGEAKGSDKQLMKDDLKMLMRIEDRFILSSISTNHYLYGDSEQFNEECENILKSNNELNKK